MEEQASIVPRDHTSSGALELISDPSFLQLGQPLQVPHLRDYLLILRKHLWLILCFLLTIVTLATIAVFKMQPMYEATSRLVMERERTNFRPVQEQTGYDSYVDMENY